MILMYDAITALRYCMQIVVCYMEYRRGQAAHLSMCKLQADDLNRSQWPG